MGCKTYKLVFQLESPLHIGWRKIGNLMQTRYYVPGRALWGSVTSILTRLKGDASYSKTGALVKDHLRFGYFFPAKNIDQPLYPKESPKGVVYGKEELLSKNFESEFINVAASTAISSESNAAEEASLHEVEFIKPTLESWQPVYLIGHLFVNDCQVIKVGNKDVEVLGFSLFSQVIASLQLGGERRYGFGRLKLCHDLCHLVEDVFGYPLHDGKNRFLVKVRCKKPILAHAAVAECDHLEGSIEPLVSREWSARGPGREVVQIGLCYTPGSIVNSNDEVTFTIGNYGIWYIQN